MTNTPHWIRAAGWFLLAAVAPAAEPPAALPDEARERIEAFFAADDVEVRAALLEGLDALAPEDLDWDATAAWMAGLARTGTRSAGENPRRLADPDHPGEYHVLEPEGWNGTDPIPMLVALHGGGLNQGSGTGAIWTWRRFGKDVLGVFPSTPHLVTGAWNFPDQEHFVLAVIEEVMRTYPVDPNRVYLCGHSMGGYGTWWIGGRHADRFAALASCASHISPLGFPPGEERSRDNLQFACGVMANLLNTPIDFYQDPQDPTLSTPEANRITHEWLEANRYEHRFREIEGIGHGWPREGLRSMLDWMYAHERDPYPARVVFEPSRPWKRRLFWLEVERPFDRTGETGKPGPRFDVTLEDNVFTIREFLVEGRSETERTEGVPSVPLTLWLDPSRIDFTRPVRVTAGEAVLFEGPASRSLAALATCLADTRDPAMAYPARIRVR